MNGKAQTVVVVEYMFCCDLQDVQLTRNDNG